MSTDAGQHGSTPVPGWYADPQGSGHRWWDGQRWTEHMQGSTPASAPVATAVHPSASAAATDASGSVGFAPLGRTSGDGASGMPSPYGDGSKGTFGTPGALVQPGQYGAPGPYGTPGQYGAPGPYGTPGQHGAPGPYGTPDPFAPKPPAKNSPATVGMVIGIVALVVGLASGFYVGSFFGIAMSAQGLRRAKELAAEGYGPVGRSRSVWGLVLSGICLAVVLVLRILSV